MARYGDRMLLARQRLLARHERYVLAHPEQFTPEAKALRQRSKAAEWVRDTRRNGTDDNARLLAAVGRTQQAIPNPLRTAANK